MATAAVSPPPRSPRRISLAEESLVLPAQNPRLFALVFLLIFAHTFLFVSVAVLRVHPLAAATMEALQSTDDRSAAAATDEVWGHGKELALLYVAYLASKLATQAAAVLAASATRSGDLVIRCKPILRARPSFFVITSVLTAAALELVASAALLLALTSSTSLLLCPGCLLLFLCLGTLLPGSIAAASVAYESCGSARALRSARRLVAARREDAAVVALAAGLLPVAVYPVYALALEFAWRNAAINPFGFDFDVDRASGEFVWALGVPTYAYLLPSVGVQLFSAVAATVFYHRCREERRHALTSYVPLVAVTVKQ